MSLERDWATALSQLRDGRVAVYPALLNATIAKNGDDVLHVTLADAGCLEQVESYGTAKVAGFLTSALKIGQVDFCLPESKNGSTPKVEEPEPEVVQKPSISKAGKVEVDAEAQCEIAERLARLKGPGQAYAAPVFMWLSSKVFNVDGLTNPFSYSQIAEGLGTDWRAVKKAIALLVKGGLVLSEGAADDYNARRYRLYGYRYISLRAANARSTSNGCTSAATEDARAARPKSLSDDDVDILLGFVEFIKHHQHPDSKRVQGEHVESAEIAAGRAADAPAHVQPLHPTPLDPETEHRRSLLRAFGVASPKALDDITAVMRRHWHGLDWLLGWMIEYQYRWITNVDELRRPKWSKDEMVGLFVTQVRSGIDKPPAQALSLAQETLADLKSEVDFTEDALREKLAGISHYTFGNEF